MKFLARQDRLPVRRWCECEPREGQWCWEEDWHDKIIYQSCAQMVRV